MCKLFLYGRPVKSTVVFPTMKYCGAQTRTIFMDMGIFPGYINREKQANELRISYATVCAQRMGNYIFFCIKKQN